jgi:hypothetical protein
LARDVLFYGMNLYHLFLEVTGSQKSILWWSSHLHIPLGSLWLMSLCRRPIQIALYSFFYHNLCHHRSCITPNHTYTNINSKLPALNLLTTCSSLTLN